MYGDNLNQHRRNGFKASPIYVLFDGTCASCHFVVRFLLKRRHRNRFRFLSLQSLENTPFEEIVREHCGVGLNESLVVWKNGVLYSRALAVCALLSELGFPFILLLVVRLLPVKILNVLYDLYARHRYQLFGAAQADALCSVLPDLDRRLMLSEWPERQPIFGLREKVFLTAEWRNLIIVNYVVPSSVLEAYLPEGVEVDTWQGHALVSLVAFSFLSTSFGGLAAGPYSDFEEVNLRFYCKREVGKTGDRQLRRGVVFVRELVPFAPVAFLARALYGERYKQAQMDSRQESHGEDLRLRYAWSDGQRGSCSVTAICHGSPEELRDNSIEAFITEHYFGYSRTRKGETLEYEVEHPSWRLWQNPQVIVEGDMAQYYPAVFAPYLRDPHSVLVAEGSPVRVFRGQSLGS
jgi:predicted DCC family thiol-disulfide oxidoreductase YuxK/uncharacterized protein YqjF (DUF2071 family)